MHHKEIRETVDLRAWLRDRPKDTRQANAVTIATRTALRVFPFCTASIDALGARNVKLPVLLAFRRLLTSGVARKYLDMEVSVAAEAILAAARNSAVPVANDIAEVVSPADSAAAAAAFAAYAADVSDSAAADVAVSVAVLGYASAVSATTSTPDSAVATMMWDQTSADLAMIQDRGDPFLSPLWSTAHPNWFDEMDQKARAIWAADPTTWSFWLRWWDGVLAGRPLDWELQKQVALIPDEVWKQGPAAVAEAIAKIEGEFRDQVTVSQVTLLLHAALADYSFDAIGRVMRMVPFEEDIRHLRDPAALAIFLDDADSLRDDLELFSRGLAAEGSMQHAGFARTYLDGILEEFSRARQLNHLRVGRVVELGKVLEEYAASQEVAAEFGPAIHALKSHLQSLLHLTRRHFAATMTRMAPLRDLSSGPDDNQWTLLQDIQRGIKAMANPRSPDLRPLAADDMNLLLSMAESIERLLRQNDVVATPHARSSLRREVDYGLALLSVSVALYLEKARTEGHSPGKVLDWIATQYKRSTGLIGLWEIIKKLWT